MQKSRIIASLAICLVGAVMLGDGLYIWSKAAFGQILLDKAWQHSAEQAAPNKPWHWADMRALARMTLPAQGRTSIILDDTSGEALAWGPGHMAGTALPGDAGLSVIAGHRDTHFDVLGKIKPGDLVHIERYDGASATFTITERLIVDGNKASLPTATDRPVLALVTCWPLDAINAGGPERLVVLAEEISYSN